MSSERFYRGGSRSSYGAQWWTGRLTLSSAGASTTMITAVSLAKVKRAQVVVMIPKASSAVSGYMAFYRELPDTTTNVSGLDIQNPQLLRPKVFVSNPDHAVYLEMYLEAITLDVGEKLHLFADMSGGSPTIVIASAKWYVERELHV